MLKLNYQQSGDRQDRGDTEEMRWLRYGGGGGGSSWATPGGNNRVMVLHQQNCKRRLLM